MLLIRTLFSVFGFGLFGSLLATPAAAAPPKLPTSAQLALVPGNPALSYRLAKIEAALDARRQALHIPGASLVIVKDDKILYMKGFGLRNVEKKLPVTPDTLFAIGSSTKAFTAMTVLMGADEGKLSLSDSPKKYVPYFKLRDPEADSKITISDLLCHRSGLDRTDLCWYTGALNAKQVIEVAGRAKPKAKFGEKFQYQNVMFLVAGEAVGQAEQTPWTKFLAKRIFQPLGMTTTNTSVPQMLRSRDYALGYTYDEKMKKALHLPMRDLPSIAPAGAINSNATDMAQWLRLMLGGGVFQGKRLVSEKNFSELYKKRITVGGNVGYGYGWFLRDWRGHPVVEHGGNIDGFNAQVALMPDQKLGFALLTNVSASPLVSQAMATIWRNLVDTPEPPPASASAPALASAPAAAVDPAAEAGTYSLTELKMDFVIGHKDGKLTVKPTGQPTMALEPMGGRRYKVGPPAPSDVVITFRPRKDNPKETEMALEQSGQTFVLKRKEAEKPSTFVPPFSAEVLMQKFIAAAGGEANLRKHRAMVIKFAVEFEHQGLNGEGVLYARAPNAQTEEVIMRGAGRKIATLRDWFDGKQGGSESTFSPATPKAGKALIDAGIAADFYPELNWKTLFKTVTIKAVSKVGDEEVYVVEKVPEKGSPIKDYISTKSFLLLRRDAWFVAGEGVSVPLTETLSDYRDVDGVKVAFKRWRVLPGTGDMALTVKEVKFDVPIPDKAFQPRPTR